MSKRKSWAAFDSIETVQEFIDENNITCPKDFKDRFICLYSKCQRKQWLKDLKYSYSGAIKRTNSWNHIKSIEDAQIFISSNKIRNRTELSKLFAGLFQICYYNDWFDNLLFEENRISWKNINSLELAQEFINENNISSPTELNITFPGLYDKCRNMRWVERLVYKITNKSNMELHFDKLYPVADYPTFIRNRACFPWLVDRGLLRPDVVIPEIKLVIELQGPQHFIDMSNFFNMSFEQQLERDKLKNKLLKSHGYEVIYFIDLVEFRQIKNKIKEFLLPNSYFETTLITEWEVLKNIIDEKLKITIK